MVSNEREQIRAYLSRFSRDSAWLESDNIFARGVINSMMAVELVAFIEKAFRLTLEDDDLDMANFRSIDGMVALVQRKRAG